MSVENTHFGAERIAELLEKCKSIYFIGIGGINMSSLAHITHRLGFVTGGSDRTETELTKRLEEAGICVSYTHDEKNARDYDAFVYTVAIAPDNPEYRYALEAGKPCISRADYLGYVMMRYSLRAGISGMHGKSTCTSMCAEIFIKGGYSPTVLSGAELPSMNGAYCLGNSDIFVFEACEYMDSFLDFNPNIAVLLNIEMEHVDYFKSMEQIIGSFSKFASLVGNDGCIVYNADDENVCRAIEGLGVRKMGFSMTEGDVTAENVTERGGRYSFDIVYMGKYLCRAELCTAGRHNIYNALAAAAVAVLCGAEPSDIAKGLNGFCGARRRMEYKGEINGASVYDDYAHHPTEIRATLSGAHMMTDKKLFCVYQPHTYSRTSALLDEFVKAFEACDRIIFADIYAAREKNVYGVSSALLAERVGERAVYADSFERAAKILSDELKNGDLAVVMGAGDIYKVFGYLDFKREVKNEGI